MATHSHPASAHSDEPSMPRGFAPITDGECTILISDMCGFTSTTRKLGIVHFASLILAQRALLKPLWQHFNALHIFTEADNFWVVFKTAADAVQAAFEAQKLLAKYNEGVPEDFKLLLSGFGIESGSGVWKDAHDGKFFGEVVNEAFHLGEDLVEDCGVLVGPRAYEAVKDHELLKHLQFKQGQDPEDENVKFFEIEGELKSYTYVETHKPDANASVELLVQRAKLHNNPELFQATDMKIKENTKPYTALMYGCDWPDLAEQYSTTHMLTVRGASDELVESVLKRANGIRLEAALYIFTSLQDAVSGALQMKQEIYKYNVGKREKEQIPLRGIGVHYGDILFIDGTDVHWGDPVNTASKLGEDLARNADVLVSPIVLENLHTHNPEFAGRLAAEKRILHASRTDLTCYSVSWNTSVTSGSSSFSLNVGLDGLEKRFDSLESKVGAIEATQREILTILSELKSAVTK